MKKIVRFLLGVFILTMLSTTPMYAADFNNGKQNIIEVGGEKKAVLVDNDGNIVKKPAGTWYTYNGKTYYFKEDNYLAWEEILQIGEDKYYFGGDSCIPDSEFYRVNFRTILVTETGALAKPGWNVHIYPNGDKRRCYVGEDQFLPKQGELKIEGKKYYFDYLGYLVIGHVIYDVPGEDVRLATVTDETGAYLELKNTWYECNEDGSKHKHYFREDGYFYVNGVYEIDGVNYEFDHVGYFMGEENTEIGWFEKFTSYGSDGWYYRTEDGELLKNGIYEIDGKKYCFNADGKLQVGYVTIYDEYGKPIYRLTDKNGALYETNGWVYESGGWYYLQGNYSRLIEGIYRIDGKRYYFDLVGEMGIGQVTVYNDDGSVSVYTTDESGAIIEKNGWVYDNGYWYYYESDSSLLRNDVYLIDGKYYYFDRDGRMNIGWMRWENGFAYSDSSGVLQKGWAKIEGYWYYFGADFILYKGWLTSNGVTYYLNESSGKMAVGFTEIDGKTYYFNADGELQKTGWVKVNGNWYYINAKDQVHTGWLHLGTTTYYLNENGVMLTGAFRVTDEKTGKEKLYVANTSGVVVTKQGWMKLAPKETAAEWYYVLADGSLANSGKYTIDGKKYEFQENGVLLKNRFGGDECLEPGRWYKQGGYWYYLDENGEWPAGWKEVDGKKYIFRAGRMQVGIISVKVSSSQVEYFVTDENGELITKKGWYKHGGVYYYIQDNGRLLTYGKEDADVYINDCPAYLKYIDGKLYAFDNSSSLFSLIQGRLIGSGENKYLVNDDGEILPDHVGWYKLKSGWVYFTEKNKPAKGYKKINGVEYVFGGNTTWSMLCDGVNWAGDYMYYADTSGKIAKNRWIQQNGYWYYATSNGTLARNEWRSISGKKYYFDTAGRMVTTDIQVDGVWYRFNTNGEYTGERIYFTGWKEVNGEWYYNDRNGKPYTGWVSDTYYIKDGKMVCNDFVDTNGYNGNKSYFFGDNGQVIKQGWGRWEKFDYEWVYIDKNGKAAYAEWKYIDGVWYYFRGYTIDTGIVEIDNKLHEFSASGAWIREISGVSKWVYLNGNWYYYDKSGNLVVGEYNADAYGGVAYKNYWIDGELYRFGADGKMATDIIQWSSDALEYVYIGKDGKETKLPNGWNKISGDKWCYVAAGYEILEGKQIIEGKEYYFDNGYMKTGWIKTKPQSETDIGALYWLETEFYGPDGSNVSQKDGWHYDGKYWYYIKDGDVLTGMHSIGGKDYEFDTQNINYGKMFSNTKYLGRLYGKDGAMLKKQWIKLADGWYYANAYGEAVKGKQVIDGVTYYFNNEGLLIQ